MDFIVVLFCLGLQKLWPEGSRYHPQDWFKPYYFWIKEHAQKISLWKEYLSIIAVILPLLIGLLLLNLILHGVIGHFLLSILVLWYCLGFDRLILQPGKTMDQVLLMSYHQIFAMIFWFAIVGPWGVAIYYLLMQLKNVLQQEDPKEGHILPYLAMIQGSLDWAPARILSISFAVLSQITVLLPVWLKQFPGRMDDSEEYIIEWGARALEHTEAGSSKKETFGPEATQSLVERTLIVWLVALALLSIGSWVG